jgi:hypothetical protein
LDVWKKKKGIGMPAVGEEKDRKLLLGVVMRRIMQEDNLNGGPPLSQKQL